MKKRTGNGIYVTLKKTEEGDIRKEIEASKRDTERDREDNRRGRGIRYNEMAFMYETPMNSSLCMLALKEKDNVVGISSF